MEINDSRREENFQEYLRLKGDQDYLDVTFDEVSGGVSAVHKEHCFDKQMGPFGCRRGDYERHVINVLRKNGYSVILLPERMPKSVNIKQFDALFDYEMSEIKTVEGRGHWSIRTKLYDAAKQGADVVILYFPEKQLFSESRIQENWVMNNAYAESVPDMHQIKRLFVVVEDRLTEIAKPPG